MLMRHHSISDSKAFEPRLVNIPSGRFAARRLFENRSAVTLDFGLLCPAACNDFFNCLFNILRFVQIRQFQSDGKNNIPGISNMEWRCKKFISSLPTTFTFPSVESTVAEIKWPLISPSLVPAFMRTPLSYQGCRT